MNLTLEQVEQLQQDIITHCDGLDDILITNLCQVVVDHYKGKSQMSYRVVVWDVTFCKVDDDGIMLRNEDGTVKLFHDPKMDCSHISEYVEEDDLVEYDEKTNG